MGQYGLGNEGVRADADMTCTDMRTENFGKKGYKITPGGAVTRKPLLSFRSWCHPSFSLTRFHALRALQPGASDHGGRTCMHGLAPSVIAHRSSIAWLDLLSRAQHVFFQERRKSGGGGSLWLDHC